MRVLIVDDDALLTRCMERYLQGKGFEVEGVSTAAEADRLAKAFDPDAVFLDLFLPDRPGLEILSSLRTACPHALLVVMSGGNTTRTSVEAMRLGADDCIDKPFALADVFHVLERAHIRREAPEPRSVLPFTPPACLKDYLFLRDPSMAEAYERIAQVAKADGLTVLIQGESGTGKQHAARLIHHLSARKKAPFLEVDCRALTAPLLESELFGAGTGIPIHPGEPPVGMLELAQGGTLYLAEVGEMPLPVQSRLIKTLDGKKLRPAGGVKERAIDIRLVASTRRDLSADVRAGRFRSDLHQRLNLVSVKMPPLRGRREAVEALTRFFVDEVCSNYGRKKVLLEAEAIETLVAYPWAGNIRELKNVVSRWVLSTRETELGVRHLPEELRTFGIHRPADTREEGRGEPLSPLMPFDDVEKETIRRALEATRWNRTHAAEALGISRRTIINKIHKWKLAPPEGKPAL